MTDIVATLIGGLIGLTFGLCLLAFVLAIPRINEWTILRKRIRNRPKHYVEPNEDNSPMTIYQAALSVADRLRAIWANDPYNLERLEALVSILDPRTDHWEWESLVGDVVQTWPDEPEDPEALEDRILWELQSFIEFECCAGFNPDLARDAFAKLTVVLREIGIDFPDASNVTFNRLC